MTSNVCPLVSHRTSLYSRMIYRLVLLMIMLQLNVALAQTSLPLSTSPLCNSTSQGYPDCGSSTTISLPTSLSSVSASSAPSNTPRSSISFAPQPSVNTTGFDYGNSGPSQSDENWLKKNNRFIFVVVLGAIVCGLIIWYIVRSVQGMRKRLEKENHAQMLMLQQAQAGRNDHHRVIPEENFNAYKTEFSSSTTPSSPASPLAPVQHAPPHH
ncbi:hypothetical protein CLU79DRAFT_730366 [Phycomyces nitens]|nr:hypothetical protein CLU79DRAFT_730366 [Phycomyces nitens]